MILETLETALDISIDLTKVGGAACLVSTAGQVLSDHFGMRKASKLFNLSSSASFFVCALAFAGSVGFKCSFEAICCLSPDSKLEYKLSQSRKSSLKDDKRRSAEDQKKHLMELLNGSRSKSMGEKPKNPEQIKSGLDATLKNASEAPQESPTVYVSGHRNAYTPFVLNQGRVRA